MVSATSYSFAQSHAPWPADWNDWSDPALWVTVDNPGNTGEWSGESYGGYGPDGIVGAVDYTYNIGKYEVTAGQYTEFLNQKAADTDTHGLYSTEMWNNAYGCKIQRSGSPGNYTYSVAPDRANRPVNYVSFWDTLRFTNWLQNGQGNGDTETGAYTLSGYKGADGRTIARNPGAKWFLPSENEWYKAAHHKNDGDTGNYFDYPTSSNTQPGRDQTESTNSGNNGTFYEDGPTWPDPAGHTIGSPYYRTEVGDYENSQSAYGTFDQGGNIYEWNETVLNDTHRVNRGGSFSYYPDGMLASFRYNIYPTLENIDTGFRVAALPDPVCGANLIGDFNLDCLVDGADFLLWQRGGSPEPFSPSDLADWQSQYGTIVPPLASSAAVPEPTSVLMLVIGLLTEVATRMRSDCH